MTTSTQTRKTDNSPGTGSPPATKASASVKALPGKTILRALRFSTLACASTLMLGIGTAEAAPYCLMRKPQQGAPANCFQFYLADLARADGGARATVSGPMCAATPMGAREGWGPDPSFLVPLPDWTSGDRAMHITSPYHQDLYSCRLASALGLSGALAAGGGGSAVAGGWTGTGGTRWPGGNTQAPAGGGLYVFALQGVGLVIATQETVRTRPACDWTGGGPRPCQAAAAVLGAFGGPYASENAARADMRTKLDCQRGHWGTFLPWGSGRFWLQNNLSGSDCRSLKQL